MARLKLSDEERRARHLEACRRYRATNRERLNSHSKAYRDNNPEKRRDTLLRSQYGITAEEYDARLSDQDGACAICGTHDPGGGKGRLHVDHCHTTGTVRGLLCHHCNTAIGHLRDSTELFQKAIAYLNDTR